MAGLLDFLQGDEAALGFGLLAAGGPSTDPNMGFGARLAGAQQMVKANQAAALKAKLIQSQLAENESQAAFRTAQVQDMQRKQAALAQLPQDFEALMGGAAPGGAMPGLLAGGGGDPGPGGAPMGAAPPTGGGQPVDVHKLTTFLAKTKIAGGPDLTDIAKMALANWQFQNNAWVNTNDPKFRGGLAEGVMNTPQGPMRLQLGPNGQPYVTPVVGSLEALTAAEDRKNVSAAKTAESGKPVYDEATGRWVTRSKADVLGLQEPAAAPSPRVTLPGRPFGALPGYGTETAMKGTVAGDMGADPAAARREIAAIERDLAAPGKVPDQASRQMLTAQANDLRRQLGNIGDSGGGAGAGRGSGGAVVQLSAAEEAANKARERLQTGVAEAAAANIKGSQEQAQSAADTLRNVEQIRSGINDAILGPGANARVSMLQIGQVLGVGGKDAAQTLSNTRNVIQGLARQELSAAGQMKGQGQITENEREILRRAEAGKISDLTKLELQTLLSGFEKPANYRLKSHEDLLGRVKGGASPTDLMSVPTTSKIEPKAAKPGGASGEWSGGKNIVPDLPKTAPVGARARDTVTGKILKFDGMMWKPE